MWQPFKNYNWMEEKKIGKIEFKKEREREWVMNLHLDIYRQKDSHYHSTELPPCVLFSSQRPVRDPLGTIVGGDH